MINLLNILAEETPQLISAQVTGWEAFMTNPWPWLCFLIPMAGALLMPLIAKAGHKVRDYAAVLFALGAVVAAASLLPGLWAEHATLDIQVATWITYPNGNPLMLGVLIDPLSIMIANVVAFIAFLIVVYSVGYMHGDEHLTRYWFFFLFFIGSMLLLVLSDNLIQMLIGWEGVGLCSYGLIGYYYRDNKERWLGGPPPTKMFPPSHAGMKAFVVTGIGDVFLLGAIFVIYNYAGTLNFIELIERAPEWMAAISAVPGLLSVTALLFLGGPIGKSAQFPLHEWLPEAMAGPTAVSALIHAATMVKAGVYLVARMAPAFYIGTFAEHLAEAQTYFVAIAIVGAFTAFLAASQAMVALELKKVLAYSTVSQIGFMMLGLGVSGLRGGQPPTGAHLRRLPPSQPRTVQGGALPRRRQRHPRRRNDLHGSNGWTWERDAFHEDTHAPRDAEPGGYPAVQRLLEQGRRLRSEPQRRAHSDQRAIRRRRRHGADDTHLQCALHLHGLLW